MSISRDIRELIARIRMLVCQLRNKLGDDPGRPRFIMTAQGVGYRLAVPES